MKIVEVEWMDTAQEGGWRTLEENAARLPDRIVSVGYLITDEDDRIVILQSRQIEGDLGADTTVIPRACVVGTHLLSRLPSETGEET